MGLIKKEGFGSENDTSETRLTTDDLKRKGQLTVSILLGLLIVFSFMFVMFVKSMGFESGVKSVEGFEKVESVVEQCIIASSNYAFYVVGRQGGYVDINTDYLQTPFSKIAISTNGYENNFVEIDHVEGEVINLVKELTPPCVRSSIPSDGSEYDFDYDSIDAKIRFTKEGVDVKLDLPVRKKKEGSETEMRYFLSSIPVRFSYVHEVAEEVVKESIENRGTIEIYELFFKKDLIFEIIPYEENNLLIIRDLKSSIRDEPYSFFLVI